MKNTKKIEDYKKMEEICKNIAKKQNKELKSVQEILKKISKNNE